MPFKFALYHVIVSLCQCQDCSPGTDETEKHIGLRVPDVSLSPQEGIPLASRQKRYPPLEKFIASTCSQDDRNGKEIGPSPAIDDGVPDQDFSGNQNRNESLHEMPYLVIVVPGKYTHIPQPVEQRDFGIRPVPADHENDGMDEEEKINETGKAEFLEGAGQDNKSDQRRCDLQEPGQPVPGGNSRDHEGQEKEDDINDQSSVLL